MSALERRTMRVLMAAMTKGKVRLFSSGTQPGPKLSLPSGPDLLQRADESSAHLLAISVPSCGKSALCRCFGAVALVNKVRHSLHDAGCKR